MELILKKKLGIEKDRVVKTVILYPEVRRSCTLRIVNFKYQREVRNQVYFDKH